MNRIHEDPLVQCLRIFMVIEAFEAQHLPCCCFDQDSVPVSSAKWWNLRAFPKAPRRNPLPVMLAGWPRIANPMDLVQDWEARASNEILGFSKTLSGASQSELYLGCLGEGQQKLMGD